MERRTESRAGIARHRSACKSATAGIRTAGETGVLEVDWCGNPVRWHSPDCESETEATLLALAEAVEQRDSTTGSHCERLARISIALGCAMRLDQASILALQRGGYLHDIGKVGIPDSILFKPCGLTAEEWLIMRSHPGRGEEICRHVRSLAPVLPVIRHHHERWDGSGYPDGLRGEQIPLLARVLQVADIYDALTNSRPYKPALPPLDALRVIEEEAARGWRDPEVVRHFRLVHRAIGTELLSPGAPGTSLAGLQKFLTAS
jgi:putative two-component system response regulator